MTTSFPSQIGHFGTDPRGNAQSAMTPSPLPGTGQTTLTHAGASLVGNVLTVSVNVGDPHIAGRVFNDGGRLAVSNG
jgi:hypothetical protein